MNKVVFPLTAKKTPAVPKDTDWREYRGPANTKMVGVMIPKGVIVFDLDTYKGVSTTQIDVVLGCGLNWSDAILQHTRNGGSHYVFSVPEDSDLINGQNVLGVKHFDTRSSGKGYIATGEGYDNQTFLDNVVEALHTKDFWPELPEKVIKMLKSNDYGFVDESDGDIGGLLELVSSQTLELTDDEVKDYLSKLDTSVAVNGDSWLKVMMAIYHQYEGSEIGWKVFDEWSKEAPEKYNEDQNRKRWESLAKKRRDNPVTFASVIEMAGGRNAIAEIKTERLIDRIRQLETKEALTAILPEVANARAGQIEQALLSKALIKQFKSVFGETFTESQIKKLVRKSVKRKESEFYNDYVFITATGEYMDRTTKVCIGPRAFDVKHDRETPLDGEGNPQKATSYVQNRIECVYSGMYAPMFDDFFTYDGVEYFNTYKPNPLHRVDYRKGTVVDKVIGHIAHLLPDEYEQKLLINYLAHNVQFAGSKLHWAIILQGVQGDGKSFLAEMMKHVLGQSNCRIISVESLDEKFTGWAENNVMVFIEELKLDNYRKYETLNKLKPYITNPTVSVRRMQRDVYETINTSNYVALTNFKDALPIDDKDRRYCVMFSQWQSKERLEEWMQDNPDYYPDLYEAMRAGAAEILDWFLSIEIDDWFMDLKRAPDTKAKLSMVQMSRSEDSLMVEDAIEYFKCYDINENVVNVTKLCGLVRDDMSMDFADFPKTSKLKNVMLDLGYHFIGRYKNKDRKSVRLYAKDENARLENFQVPF